MFDELSSQFVCFHRTLVDGQIIVIIIKRSDAQVTTKFDEFAIIIIGYGDQNPKSKIHSEWFKHFIFLIKANTPIQLIALDTKSSSSIQMKRILTDPAYSPTEFMRALSIFDWRKFLFFLANPSPCTWLWFYHYYIWNSIHTATSDHAAEALGSLIPKQRKAAKKKREKECDDNT